MLSVHVLSVANNPFKVSVIRLKVVMLSVANKPFKLRVIMLNVAMQNVIALLDIQ
jgi:hypothetical protein